MADGLVLDDAQAFDDWLTRERARLLVQRRRAQEAAATAHESQGNHELAQQRVESLLADDPLQERYHRDAMRLHMAYGDARRRWRSLCALSAIAQQRTRPAADDRHRRIGCCLAARVAALRRPAQRAEAARRRLAHGLRLADGFTRALRAVAGSALDLGGVQPWVRSELARLLPDLGAAPPPLRVEAERSRYIEACRVGGAMGKKKGAVENPILYRAAEGAAGPQPHARPVADEAGRG